MWKFLVALIIALPMALPATDTFSRCTTTLGSNWTGLSGAITDWILSDNAGVCAGLAVGAYPNYGGADFAMDIWNADSFNSDGNQYAQGKLSKSFNGYIGLGVRMSAGTNGYAVDIESGCTLYKWTSGTRSTITVSPANCGGSWTNGHTMKLEIIGNAITIYDNGASIGTATDSSIASGGAPGIIGYTDTGATISDWQADNTGGGPGATFPAALLNAPIRCCRR